MKTRRVQVRIIATAVAVALASVLSAPTPCAADFTGLGTANQYSVLGLTNTKIDNDQVTVNGNEGIAKGGSLSNPSSSKIEGSVYEYQSGQYSGSGHVSGSVNVNPTLLNQNVTDVLGAASAAAGLTATQTFGTISKSTTITGNGGVNVIDINGNITNSITLHGSASSTFIVNVSGTLTLSGSETLALSGGLTANHVLYNFTGTGGTNSTGMGDTVYGTLLGVHDSFNLDSTINGGVIGGGSTITLSCDAVVNQTPFTAVPEPSSLVLLGVGAAAGLIRVSTRRRK